MTRLEIGYVARAHGIAGELRIHLHDDASTTLFDVERVWIGGVERIVESARPTTGAVLLAIEGVEDRDAAEALRGQTVEVLREDVPLEEGEFFLADLPGYEVVTDAGEAWGRVAAVQNGPQDLLIIRDDAVERMLPLVPEFIVSVDAATRRIVVAPPEDLPADPIRPGKGGR
jgi:16S rRNA processing protein RimM